MNSAVPAPASAKAVLRKTLLAERHSLAQPTWQARSQALCSKLETTSIYQQAETVLIYWSFRQEPDLTGLWNRSLEQQGKKKFWALPRCVGKQLVWHRWKPGDALVSGAFDIKEPTQNSALLDPAEADLILVPAVGCDRQGNRLGYGGGFYDRLLSHPDCRPIPTIGIVFDFAHVETLPRDPWDCPLDGVCTERGYFPCSSSTRTDQKGIQNR